MCVSLDVRLFYYAVLFIMAYCLTLTLFIVTKLRFQVKQLEILNKGISTSYRDEKKLTENAVLVFMFLRSDIHSMSV